MINIIYGAGEMVQQVRALTGCSSRGPEFNSQQPHSGSQPSIMRSDALFWHTSKQSTHTYVMGSDALFWCV